MEEGKKNIVLKGIHGEDITFIVNTLVSEWHSEQIEKVYLKHMNYDMDKKQAVFSGEASMSDIGYERNNALVETFVEKWMGMASDQPCTVENIKKTLAPTEYDKLLTELESIYGQNSLSEEKKSPLPNS